MSDLVASTDYQTAGVTWASAGPDGDLGVQVRTRTDGAWSRWTALEDDGVSPDAGTTEAGRDLRGGTESVWIGDADALQLSFPTEAAATSSDVRLVLVGSDAAADSTTVDRGAVASRSVPRTEVAAAVQPTATVAAAVAAPGVISRAAWGAAPARCALDVASTLLAAVVHHTAGPNTYSSVAEAMAQIRNDQKYHQDGRGWCDIGYNFLVDKWGNVYEGRADSGTKPVIGVHAGGFNTATVGISMVGDYSSITPSAAVQESVARLIAWRLSAYHRDPTSTIGYTTLGGENSRFAAGTYLALPVVIGHRDVAFTACPGENAYAVLGAIKSRARQLIGASWVNPSASTTSVAYGSGLTVSGGVISTIDWTLSIVDQRTGVELVRRTGAAGPSGGSALVGWDGRSDGGTYLGTGTYRLTLSGTERGSGVPVVPWSTAFAVTGSQNPPVVPAVPVVGNLAFVPVVPTRLTDTRFTGASLGPASRMDLSVTGVAGIPADAKAVALNVTTVASSAWTFLRVWPAGQPMPDASVLNSDPARTTGAGVVSAVGGGGKVSIYNNSGSTHVVVDVTGYFVEDSAAAVGYAPLATAARVLDTRAEGGRLVAGANRTVQVAGRSGIPAGAKAVLVNVSSVMPTGVGNIVAYPSGGAVPTVASVNHLPGDNVSNRTIVPLGADGKVTLALQGASADVVLDVVGWFGTDGALRYTPIVPARAWDTRLSGGPLAAGEQRDMPLTAAELPAEARVAMVALAATQQTARMTFLTAWAPPGTRPLASDLNTGAGRDQVNLSAVPIAANRTVRVYNDAGTAHVVVDVEGWFG
ncbi:peptidoglycan recognition protein family protein [Cellulomonas sp. ICMP 17802]|uniref:peptidoglycan recognition protein family protein n=1 Tax=Cellulomonas sp. ICMP 17802 TaxID=3239199 RepID=UPI00351BD051